MKKLILILLLIPSLAMAQYNYDNSVGRSQTLKAHILTQQDARQASAWTNFTGFTLIPSETTSTAIELTDDSTFTALETGMFFFGGCVHCQNNTVGIFSGITVLSRIFINNATEARCSQRGYVISLAASGGEDVLSYNGTVYLEKGDYIRLQYYTSNASLDFDSNDNFVNQVAATLHLTFLER